MTTKPLFVNYSGLRVHKSLREWLMGVGGFRPFMLIIAAIAFILFAFVLPVHFTLGLFQKSQQIHQGCAIILRSHCTPLGFLSSRIENG